MRIPSVTGRRRNYLSEEELYRVEKQVTPETREEEAPERAPVPLLICRHCGKHFRSKAGLGKHALSCPPSKLSKTE